MANEDQDLKLWLCCIIYLKWQGHPWFCYREVMFWLSHIYLRNKSFELDFYGLWYLSPVAKFGFYCDTYYMMIFMLWWMGQSLQLFQHQLLYILQFLFCGHFPYWLFVHKLVLNWKNQDSALNKIRNKPLNFNPLMEHLYKILILRPKVVLGVLYNNPYILL